MQGFNVKNEITELNHKNHVNDRRLFENLFQHTDSDGGWHVYSFILAFFKCAIQFVAFASLIS